MINTQNISFNNASTEPIQQKERQEQQSTFTYKVCIFVLKALLIVPIGLVLSIKIIPAGSLGSFSASAPCTYTKDFFSSSASAIISLIKGRRTIFSGFPEELMQLIRQPIAQNQYSSSSSIVCQDTKESFQWKKQLIEAAEHNIVLSGNYCGGLAFDEILSIMTTQLAKKPQLKIVVLSSDKFIDASNREKIDNLTAVYPSRFQLVESPDIWTIGEKAKFSTNHSKILSIDYGKYFILGGSGLEDKYAYHEGLHNTFSSPNGNIGMLNNILPRGFRDQDFVFHSEQGYEGIGGRVHLEALKLAYTWMYYNKSQEKGSVAEEILFDQAITQPQPIVNTRVDPFHQNTNVCPDIETKILFTGPEDKSNAFAKELIEQFDQAKKRIVIDHMYFHPSEEIFNALVNAANRGVSITLITNGYDKHSPIAHKAFGPRSRFNYIALKSAVNKEHQNNIKVHEFRVRKTTLHKKVIVVDNTVIAGSSNFGYKSLVTNSDHEINFVVKNASFAEKTLEVIAVDLTAKYAKLVSNLKNLTFFELFRANIHPLIGFLIG